jgi:hypothetical protein
LDVSDSMRGTSPNTSAPTLVNQATIHTEQNTNDGRATNQLQGVSGYQGLGLDGPSVVSPYQNVRLDSGSQLILLVSGK